MNIVYNASAGTGKTYRVTQLYEKLVLEEDIKPCDILLMTFTDNAAAELRMRVAHRLIKARREAEAAGNDEVAERAMTAASRLASAPIGTIHSFCTHLLREQALNAGLSPGFAVLVGDERDELLNRICHDELLVRLDADPDFKAFCAGAHIIGTGGGFGSSVAEIVSGLIAQAGSLGISLENAEALLPGPLPPVSMDEFRIIHTRLQAIANPSKKVIEAIQVLGECLEKAGDACGVADLFDGKFSGHFSYGDARSIYPEFKALKEDARERQYYRDRFPAAMAFARYVQSVAQRFRQHKHEMNAVDFDDQLQLANALLTSGRARSAFQYVIVDEVQDTSRIQCSIIQTLWSSGAHLVICGDRKQSIYTWRGADPRVMPDLQQLIRDAGGKLENLQVSYRSKPPILEVINRLFASVYGEKEYSEQDNLRPNPDFETESEKPCVEFLAPDDETEAWPRPEKVAAEMEAVANRIRLLVQGSSEWRPAYRYGEEGFAPSDASNTYRYSDILILLRRTTHQPVLESALRHANIPYTLGGKGCGLFTRQETRDVSLFLTVLTHPQDAYALIGFLRSPWIGWSDETIAGLAWKNGTFAVDELMVRYPEQTDVIDRYRQLLSTKLASELVRMLIDETGYDALLAGLPRGEQRLANLRKVLDWLRETERGARTTPAAVARRLAEQIAHPPQIPEAALLDPAQNAVTIMTVHGAKGLTRNVVFVPDISFSDRTESGFAQVFFDEQDQPALGVRVTAPDRSSVKSPGMQAAGERAAAVRRHELNNLFYVAMTRARDLVVVSASPGKASSGWLEQMEPLIGKDIPGIPYSELSEAADRPEPVHRTHRTVPQLSAAIDSLPPQPESPLLQRIPATRLAREQDELDMEYDDPESGILPATAKTAALGSLGHAVLEQLALNDWQGSIADWLDNLRDEFAVDPSAAAALAPQIAQTRDLMIERTAGHNQLRPEFPFVLHDGNHLIDGTIDLLCRTPRGFAIYDYKFTEAGEAEVLNRYRHQMAIYRRAAERCFPHAEEAETCLIIVSSRGIKPVIC